MSFVASMVNASSEEFREFVNTRQDTLYRLAKESTSITSTLYSELALGQFYENEAVLIADTQIFAAMINALAIEKATTQIVKAIQDKEVK